MIGIVQIGAALGLRGGIGIAVGAALAIVPAYQAGKWTEAAAADERIGRVLAQYRSQQMEQGNDRISRASAARVEAGRSDRSLPDGSGLSDDGFRRD